MDRKKFLWTLKVVGVIIFLVGIPFFFFKMIILPIFLMLLGLVIFIGQIRPKQIPAVFEGNVTCFGKLEDKTRKEGLTFLIPFVEKITLWPVNLRMLEVTPDDTFTKNRMTVTTKTFIFWKIINPVMSKKSLGSITAIEEGLIKKTQAAQRMFFAQHYLNEALGEGSFSELVDSIQNHLKDIPSEKEDTKVETAKNLKNVPGVEGAWGIEIKEIRVTDVEPTKDAKKLIATQQEAEYAKAAAIVEAEKNKAVAILKAEGEKETEIRKAEAEQKKIELVAKQLGIEGDSSKYFVLIAYFEALKQIGSSNSTKIVIPQELGNIVGPITALYESIKGKEKISEEKK